MMEKSTSMMFLCKLIRNDVSINKTIGKIINQMINWDLDPIFLEEKLSQEILKNLQF